MSGCWLRAMWAIHDMQMYRIDRLTTFRRIVRAGLSRREAAELIQQYERERDYG